MNTRLIRRDGLFSGLIIRGVGLFSKRNHRSSDAPAISKSKHDVTMNEPEKTLLETTPSVKPSRLIPLTQGKFALVDEEDYERVSKLNWVYCPRRKTTGHAYRIQFQWLGVGKKPIQKHIRMHRFILGAPSNMQVDHKDGNPLNNQKSNLRLCTHLQNSRNTSLRWSNTSGFKGISWSQKRQKWLVRIGVGGETKYLGRYSNIHDAAVAYDKAAILFYGEFAKTNAMIRSREYAID